MESHSMESWVNLLSNCIISFFLFVSIQSFLPLLLRKCYFDCPKFLRIRFSVDKLKVFNLKQCRDVVLGFFSSESSSIHRSSLFHSHNVHSSSPISSHWFHSHMNCFAFQSISFFPYIPSLSFKAQIFPSSVNLFWL